MNFFNLVLHKFKVYTKIIKKTYKQKTTHSRVVFLLKIALPSMVAVFLGVLFLAPKLKEINTINFDIPKLESTDKISFTMEKGTFYGQGDNDMIFSINLDNFQENRVDNLMIFLDVEAKIFLKDATWFELLAKKADYTKADDKMILVGNVNMIDNEDNKILTEEVMVDLNSMEIIGNKPVTATTHFGKIEGEGFHFKRNDSYIFTGKIKAFINPDKLKK